jgi:hypothetical protein
VAVALPPVTQAEAVVHSIVEGISSVQGHAMPWQITDLLLVSV